MKTEILTVQILIEDNIQSVWDKWTTPNDIKIWDNISDLWHTPVVINNLKVGGRFLYRMESKDKSEGFDFSGTYTQIIKHELIEYITTDSRKVSIEFEHLNDFTIIVQNFESDINNCSETQKAGWVSVLESFKNYVEG